MFDYMNNVEYSMRQKRKKTLISSVISAKNSKRINDKITRWFSTTRPIINQYVTAIQTDKIETGKSASPPECTHSRCEVRPVD